MSSNQTQQFQKPKIPPGFVELFPGQDLLPGDAIYRYAFAQFIPLCPSQIETCGIVLSGEIVIRQTKEGKRT